MMSIRFIVSTRFTEDEFFERSLLASSLEALHSNTKFVLEPAFAATGGLAPIYNAAIDRSQADDILVFVHDDVYFDDWYLGARLIDALNRFDVVGIAGATLREAHQATWWGIEVNDELVGLPNQGTGGVKHLRVNFRRRIKRWVESGKHCLPSSPGAWRKRWIQTERGVYSLIPRADNAPQHVYRRAVGGGSGILECFGPCPAEAKLLDGVFLAIRSGTLVTSNVHFDTRFDYHFYDLDFCRQCEASGLSLGTWPIAITHASRGSYRESWLSNKERYFKKWKD